MSTPRDVDTRRRGRDARDDAWMILAAIVALSGASCAPVLHARAVAPIEVRGESSFFESGGRRIRMDVYRPQLAGKRPAVLVLHGSSGVHHLLPNTATRYARALAEQGLVAFVVHYFDATGTIAASRAAEDRHYFVWTGVMRDAVTRITADPEVDPDEIGILGHSLGGFLAVGVAASDPRVTRVVLFGGGLEPYLEDKILRMPPMLVFHGDQDDEVPLAEAQRLVTFLRERRHDVQIRVIRGEKHALSERAVNEALTEAARFFTPELRGQSTR